MNSLDFFHIDTNAELLKGRLMIRMGIFKNGCGHSLRGILILAIYSEEINSDFKSSKIRFNMFWVDVIGNGPGN